MKGEAYSRRGSIAFAAVKCSITMLRNSLLIDGQGLALDEPIQGLGQTNDGPDEDS